MERQSSHIIYDPKHKHFLSLFPGPFFVSDLDELMGILTSPPDDLQRTVSICCPDTENVLNSLCGLAQVVSVYTCKTHRDPPDANWSTSDKKTKEVDFTDPLMWLVDAALDTSIACQSKGLILQEKAERQIAVQYIQQSRFVSHEPMEERPISETATEDRNTVEDPVSNEAE